MKTYLYLKKNMFIPVMILFLLISSLLVDDIKNLFPGYLDILTSKSILLTDYLAVGGLNSTLFNCFTTLSMVYMLTKILKLRITGPIYAGMMLMLGFSFCGINTFNFIPVYIGIYIYSRIKKIAYRTLIISIIFSSGISPLISFVMFNGGNLLIFIPLGILIGVLIGMAVPAIASHVILFHSGYNLYNIGFTLGLISLLAYGICTSFGINIQPNVEINRTYHWPIFVSLGVCSISFIILGGIKFKEAVINYKQMLTRSGRLLQDFIRDYEIDAVLLNIGLNLLFCLTLIFILNLEVSGLVVASLFSVVGFSAMGKHIKNIYPVVLGALIAIFITNSDLSNPSLQAGLFFVTALSPLSGRYKVIIGLIAGFLHIIISPISILFQGPFNLYINGFIASFVAAILISIIESYEQELKYDR